MKKLVIAMLLLVLALCLASCQKTPVPAADNSNAALEEYMATVKSQSDAIKASLEQDALTQTDMNQKSQELSGLWDAALTHLLDEAKKVLPAADMEKLTAEQSAWETERNAAAEAAGKDYEGGSMYALVVNTETATLTEARAQVLYEMLAPAN